MLGALSATNYEARIRGSAFMGDRQKPSTETLLPKQLWSKNQANLHVRYSFSSYTSSFDGVVHFTEIPSAIAVRF